MSAGASGRLSLGVTADRINGARLFVLSSAEPGLDPPPTPWRRGRGLCPCGPPARMGVVQDRRGSTAT